MSNDAHNNAAQNFKGSNGEMLVTKLSPIQRAFGSSTSGQRNWFSEAVSLDNAGIISTMQEIHFLA